MINLTYIGAGSGAEWAQAAVSVRELIWAVNCELAIMRARYAHHAQYKAAVMYYDKAMRATLISWAQAPAKDVLKAGDIAARIVPQLHDRIMGTIRALRMQN